MLGACGACVAVGVIDVPATAWCDSSRTFLWLTIPLSLLSVLLQTMIHYAVIFYDGANWASVWGEEYGLRGSDCYIYGVELSIAASLSRLMWL